VRITFVLSGLMWRPGGGHRVVYEYANALARRGHAVTLVYPQRLARFPTMVRGIRQRLRRAATSLRRRVMPLDPGWFSLDSRIRRLSVPEPMDRHVPPGDIVFATWWGLTEYVAEYGADKGVKCHLIHHDETVSGYPRERVEVTWTLPMAAFAVSRATADVARQHGARDVVYLPNGVDQDTFRVWKRIEDRGTRIALAYVPRAIKDPETALAALHRVRERLPEMEVRAFGAVRRPMAWPPWIDYRRHLDDVALARDVYNESSIFVSSSILEGFGFPMAEGMACGCAIACTDSRGVRDFAEHRATALLSAPRDVDGLVKHILQLAEDRELRVRLARAGQTRIAEFTWERSSDLLEARLRELVQSQGHR
jgi:glycosyltransferase involved in cell wall biosynthesis